MPSVCETLDANRARCHERKGVFSVCVCVCVCDSLFGLVARHGELEAQVGEGDGALLLEEPHAKVLRVHVHLENSRDKIKN